MKRNFAVVLAAALSAACLGLPAAPGAGAAVRQLQIYFIDVEGGAATLIVTPAGESILVDTGWPGFEDRDPKRIASALAHAGAKQIDHLVTSHWHVDHYGGVEGLARLVPIRRYWDRGIPDSLSEDSARFPALIAAYRAASSGKRRTLKPGDSIPLRRRGLPIRLDVLAGSGEVTSRGSGAAADDCRDHPRKPEDTSDNARSLALKLRVGEFDFLNCGDLTWNLEHRLVCPVNRVGKIDLYQVTHHGMDSSNNPLLLNAAQPRAAVMANGPRKGGSESVMRLLKELPGLDAWFQLHRNMALAPEQQAPQSRIANWHEAGCGRFLRAQLSPDGKTYSIHLQSGEQLASFDTR